MPASKPCPANGGIDLCTWRSLGVDGGDHLICRVTCWADCETAPVGGRRQPSTDSTSWAADQRWERDRSSAACVLGAPIGQHARADGAHRPDSPRRRSRSRAGLVIPRDRRLTWIVVVVERCNEPLTTLAELLTSRRNFWPDRGDQLCHGARSGDPRRRGPWDRTPAVSFGPAPQSAVIIALTASKILYRRSQSAQPPPPQYVSVVAARIVTPRPSGAHRPPLHELSNVTVSTVSLLDNPCSDCNVIDEAMTSAWHTGMETCCDGQISAYISSGNNSC